MKTFACKIIFGYFYAKGVQDERLLLQVSINLFIIIVIVMKMIAIVVIFIPSYLLPCMLSALFQKNDSPRLDIVP